MNYIVRQGDQLFTKVEAPADAQFEDQGKSYIVAYGEKSNHKHVLEAEKVETFKGTGGAVFIRLMGPGVVTHDEHGPVNLEAGTYQVTQERELNHAQARANFVAD